MTLLRYPPPTRKKLQRSITTFISSRTRFPLIRVPLARQVIQRAYTPSSTRFQTHQSVASRKRGVYESAFGFVPLCFPFLRLFKRIAVDRTLNMNAAQDLLTVNQRVEGDCSVRSSLADLFEKPVGWTETLIRGRRSEFSCYICDGIFIPCAINQNRKIYVFQCEI